MLSVRKQNIVKRQKTFEDLFIIPDEQGKALLSMLESEEIFKHRKKEVVLIVQTGKGKDKPIIKFTVEKL
jgi:hypothetical protein